ncbi:MAG: NADH-quinone oxidoreductase subunit J [Anaerolineae bacterium]|nr:NADH-quinone oxidoreductase subunit J [Anaerolineae bacterium]
MTQQILFFVFGAIVLGAGVAVVTVRNIFHAALWLLLAFFGVAGLYVLLEAPFFAAVQLFVYMGAIGVLIIFAVMLTQGIMKEKQLPFNEQWWMAGLMAVLLLAVMVYVIRQLPAVTPQALQWDSIDLLGMAFVHPQGFVLPFELASVLLVAALLGAVTIARER